MDPAPASRDCTQLDLPWRSAVPAAPGVANPEHVAELYSLLKGRGWMTAKAICQLRPEWYDREYRYVRLLAAASLDILSAPGSPGYRIFDTASDTEIERYAQPLMSQGKRMFKKGVGYLRKLKIRKAKYAPAK